MKTFLSVIASGYVAVVDLPPASAAELTVSDLVAVVETPLENGVLQAVSLGAINPAGAVTAHAGTLAADDPVPPDDHTLYEIGSVTKVFTSLLLAEAVVRGEVTLDTTIAKLLPADVTLPDGAGEQITLRMLATHTSGLPRIPAEIPPDDYRDPYANYNQVDLWETLRNVKLDFAPGTKAGYSNLGGGLLGTLLARRANTSYPELLKARILDPLEMTNTVIAVGDDQASRLAPGFNSTGEPVAHWEFDALVGAGGMRSSLADMMLFAEAVLHPERSPLAEAIELTWPKQDVAASLVPGGQALGWMLAGDGVTHWHNGMTGGFHAAVFVNRDRGVAAVLLANRSTPVGTQLAESLFRVAAGVPQQPMPNRDRAEVTLTVEQLDRCTGTFRLSPEFALVVERRDRALFVTPTGQSTDRLYAAAPDTFFSRRVPAEIVFDLPNSGGPATALVLKQGGREMRAPRE